MPVLGLDDANQAWLAYVPQPTPGLTVIDDWSGFGSVRPRAARSCSMRYASRRRTCCPRSGCRTPTLNGPLSQIIQAAIDAGIAKAAIDDTLAFVRTRTRPWVDSGVERATDDPLTIREIGHLHIQLHAAEALLERAARALDDITARGEVTEDDVARASVAVGEAKVLTTEVALLAGEKLFELAGTQSTLAEHNLDRHWRNARTHTLHDPVRWKYHLVGNYYLNGVRPARHAWN